jgi:hypothetical protein
MNKRHLIALTLVMAAAFLDSACSKANLGIPPAPATALVEKQSDDSRPLVFVDSVEVDLKKDKLDPDNIKSVNVLGMSYKKELVSTYGQRARNGVIFVTTKKEK